MFKNKNAHKTAKQDDPINDAKIANKISSNLASTGQLTAEEPCSSSSVISISITRPDLEETNVDAIRFTSSSYAGFSHLSKPPSLEQYSVDTFGSRSSSRRSSSKKRKHNSNSNAIQNSLCIIDLTSAVGATSTSSSKSHYNFLSSIDSPVGYEIVKLVRALNRAVATHVALAALLGGSGDGPHLRDELRRARRTAQEAAASAKTNLISFLLDPRWADRERMELERVWCLLLCCLDSLEASMQRSLNLLREFSLADGNNVLIHTGFEPSSNYLHHHLPLPHRPSFRQHQNQSSSRGGKVDAIDKLTLEGVEASQLCKELFELRSQLQELKSTVEIRLFSQAALEEASPALLRRKPLRIDTLVSLNGTDLFVTRQGAGGGSISCSIPSDEKESLEDSDDDMTSSEGEGITPPQRRCICWIITFMMSVFGMVMLLGVFIALFS